MEDTHSSVYRIHRQDLYRTDAKDRGIRARAGRYVINTRRQCPSFDGDTNDRPWRAINRYKGDGKSVKLSRTDIPPWAFETLVSGRLTIARSTLDFNDGKWRFMSRRRGLIYLAYAAHTRCFVQSPPEYRDLLRCLYFRWKGVASLVLADSNRRDARRRFEYRGVLRFDRRTTPVTSLAE